MSDPLIPEDPTEQPFHQPGGDAEQARGVVARVRDWYNARLADAHREAGHDSGQVATWRAARDRAVDDLDRLKTADEDEIVQIALAYAARLKELQEN
ncbi:hypothetical protein [Streptomyces sp. NPDC002540]